MTSSAAAVSIDGTLNHWAGAIDELDYRVGRGLRRPDVNNRRQSLMKTSRLIVGLVAVGLLATACGDDDTASSNTAASGGTTAAAGTTAGAGTAATAAGGSAAAGAAGNDCKPVKPGVLSVVTSLPGPNF